MNNNGLNHPKSPPISEVSLIINGLLQRNMRYQIHLVDEGMSV